MDQRRSKSAIPRKSRTPVRRIPSKISRNPFLNFLKDLRKSNKNKLGVTELTKRGGQIWRSMSAREKSPYINISKQASKYTTVKSRRRRRRRSRRRGRRRRRSTSSLVEESQERMRRKQHREERSKRDQKTEEVKQNVNEREEQKGSRKFEERDWREKDEDLRLKSIDYDDIKRDYI